MKEKYLVNTGCQKVDGQEKLYHVQTVFERVELVAIISSDETNRPKTRVQLNKWTYNKEISILTLDEEVDNLKYRVVIRGKLAVPWALKHIEAKANTLNMAVNDRIGVSGVDFFYDSQQQTLVFSKELSDESTRYYLLWEKEDVDGIYFSGNALLTDKMREVVDSFFS